MEIDIIKSHGTGNDFILIDEMKGKYNLNEKDRKEMAIELCKREKVIGADGILFVQDSDKYHGKMQILNADGSEAQMCGNGLRCVGRYLIEKLGLEEIRVETLKASYKVKKVKDLYKGVFTDEITLDTIFFKVKKLPLMYENETLFFKKLEKLSEKREFSAMSITNPHLVSIVEEIDVKELEEVGIKANNTREILPEGVNINYVKELSQNNIFVKTYERGVGLTKSCGTGMICASVIVSIKNNWIDKEINVLNDGGVIKTIVKKDDNGYKVIMKGNATFIYKGKLKKLPEGFVLKNKMPFLEEEKAYDEFLNTLRQKNSV